MERFHGKKLIECQVSDGISKADALVEKGYQGDAPVYQAGTAGKAERRLPAELDPRFTSRLMNGVSHILPFVVGGILIALAFLIDGLSVDMNSLSAEARGKLRYHYSCVCHAERNRRHCIRTYASGTGRFYCHEY